MEKTEWRKYFAIAVLATTLSSGVNIASNSVQSQDNQFEQMSAELKLLRSDLRDYQLENRSKLRELELRIERLER